MLTTGYIELESTFAQGANSGSYLSYYVEDPDAISVFDTVQQSSNVDTLAAAGSAGAIAALRQVQGTTDSVVAAFSAASGIEVGDAVQGNSTLAATGATAAVITELKTAKKVTAVKQVASGNMTSVVMTAGAGSSDADTIVVTKVGHGISVGDIVLIASSALPSLTTDTAATVAAGLDGYQLVTAKTDDTFTFTPVIAGLTVNQTSKNFTAGTVAVHNITIDLASTTDVTASSAVLTTGAAGGFAELTDADALDSLANLRVAAFGAAGVIGSAGTAVSRSTTAATINNYVVDTRNASPANGAKVIRFGTTSDTAKGSIKVTAFVDNDADGVIDSTEYVSTTRTITFVQPSDVVFSIGQKNVYLGSDTVTGTVSADLNLDEIGTQGLLELSIDHIDASAPATRAEDSNSTLTFDATDKNLQASDADLNGDAATTVLAIGDSIRFAVVNASDNVELGSPATFGVGTLAVAGSSLVVSATKDNTEVAAKDADGVSMPSQAVSVRKGTASVVATYTAFDGSPLDTTADKVVANAPYTATVTSSSVTAADGVKVNATVVDGGSETFTGSTDANGQVVLTLTQTAADASDVVTVSLNVQGKAASALVAFTYSEAEYEVYNVAGGLTSSTDYNKSLVVGGTLAQTYWVADQFGTAPVNGTVVVTATRSGSRTDTAATWGYQVPVVSGLATVSIVDNGKGTGSDTVTIKSVPLLAGGSLDSEDDSNTYTLTYVTSAADYTPTAVTGVLNYDGVDDTTTNDQPVAIETKALVNYDSRGANALNAPVYATNNVDTTSPADTVDAQLTLSGVVNNAANGLIAGAPVTIKATGLVFKFTTADGATIYGKDSITVNTSATGAYSVNVYGDRGGKQAITVTAGAATASTSVTFAVGTPATLALKTSAIAKSGRAVDVVATVTDKYGVASKGATVSFTTTGAGYLNSASGVTDANGKVTLKLILGSGETGITTVTATTSIAGVDVVQSGFTLTGVSAKITKAKNSVATVKNAAGATITVVRGTKSKTVIATSNSQKVTVKGGTGTVKVYVNDIKVASK
jgi:hypothetical protein